MKDMSSSSMPPRSERIRRYTSSPVRRASLMETMSPRTEKEKPNHRKNLIMTNMPVPEMNAATEEERRALLGNLEATRLLTSPYDPVQAPLL